jgi:hypothetical protein
MFDFIGKAVDSVCDTVEEFVDDPIRKTVEVATQPLRDGVEVFRGLTEGELRVAAATRLGVDVASGMALGELVDWAGVVDWELGVVVPGCVVVGVGS